LKTNDNLETDGSDNSVALTPNLTDIKAQLHALFNPAFVQAHPDAWFEIAYCLPDGRLDQTQNYPVFDLKDAAEFAEAKNKAGYNIYAAPALRTGKHPRSGRANFDHVQTSAFAWVEFDNKGDAERVKGILDANNLVPALSSPQA
jgi:hypothetical protein